MRVRIAIGACLAAALGACTFSPGVNAPAKDGGGDPIERDGGIVDPPRDAGVVEDVDAGELDAGERLDAGSIDGGPFFARITGPRHALPWDSVELSGAESSAPGEAALTYMWSVEVPTEAKTGLGVYPGTSTTSTTSGGPVIDLHVSAPGDYVVELTLSDGERAHSTTATVTVPPFVQIPLERNDEVESLVLDPTTAALWIGTRGQGLHRYEPGAAMALDIACTTNARINAMVLTKSGTVAMATEAGLFFYDGDCPPAPAGQVSKRRGIVLAEDGEDLYVAGDPGVQLYDAETRTLGPDFVFDYAGASQKLYGAERDGDGNLWFGSDENEPIDGVTWTAALPDPLAPRVDLFPGENDKPKALRAGPGNELWVLADRGIAHIPDARNPASVSRFRNAMGLPVGFADDAKDAVVGPDGDVWIGTNGGIVRYKRSLALMVVIPKGGWGLPADAEVRGIAIDQDATRGRAVYAGGRAGLWIARTPP